MKRSGIVRRVRIAALVSILALSVSTLVSAANFVNGDFETGDETGWTQWRAIWGSGQTWNVNAGGWSGWYGALGNSTAGGSFGWFQRVPVTIPGTYAIDGEWTGNIGSAGWAEIMFFPANSTDNDEDIIFRIDATAAAADIAFKKDSWGMNPPTSWGVQQMSSSPHPSGNGGSITVTTEDQIVIAIKLGSGGGANWLQLDNLAILEPTSVVLTSFSATAKRRAIRLDWETASEIDNLGFNLYRSESPEGERVQLNTALIPSQNPGSPLGAVYTWRDGAVTPGVTYYYWLEDVDLYGRATLHGPVSAMAKPKAQPGGPVVQPGAPEQDRQQP